MSLTNASPEVAARAAKQASYTLGSLPASARNSALEAMHAELEASREEILAANARDVELAGRNNTTTTAATAATAANAPLLSRLNLGRPGKWEDMLRGVLEVRDLPDPLGAVTLRTRLDDGLVMERVSCPIGVLLVIFEARPEVIANIASLAIKSGNAVILKGGKESTESFIAIGKAIARALARPEFQVPLAAVQLVTTRDAVAALLAQDRFIDLVVPRGSNELVRHVKATTRIPVLGHADGLCSIYLTATADPARAAAAIVDAKTSYPAACNSVETLLVEEAALGSSGQGGGGVFGTVVAALVAAGVELRCDAESKAAAVRSLSGSSSGSGGGGGGGHHDKIVDAVEADYDTEHLSLTLAVRTVRSVDEAVAHIHAHGSGHTEAIMTAERAVAERFMDAVDAAGAFWNASTRLADGMRYGFGTEVGISTSKVHARGPVGLDGLTIYKYKVRGDYQPAAAYGHGPGQKAFKHEKMAL